MKPIPFDSLCLSVVLGELQPWVGAKVQRISQPTPNEIVIELHQGGIGWLLISADPSYTRAHFVTKKPTNPVPVPGLCAALRSHLEGGYIASVAQPNGDRVLELEIQAGAFKFRLVAELIGRHANLILLDTSDRVVTALKTMGPSRSTRPIQIGRAYPHLPAPTNTASPFLRKLREAGVDEHSMGAFVAPGFGAYPLPVQALGYEALARPTLSIALEQAFDARIATDRGERKRRELVAQLDRVILAREVALQDLVEARDSGRRAGHLQLQAELILAYGHEWQGERLWLREDYEGNPVEIRMDSELTALENAQRYFDRAKRAKARQPFVIEQIARIEEDLAALRSVRGQAESATERELDRLVEEADRRRWRHAKTLATKPEERPFEGHRIREYLGPGGFSVLVGENATANDYLTLRVAKPEDWWLHVRGATSAHVIIRTHRKPERVSKEVFEFAAKLAVRHSTQKHASYVPVDITQRRYVRRIKGSAPGTVQYTHERTIHVEI